LTLAWQGRLGKLEPIGSLLVVASTEERPAAPVAKPILRLGTANNLLPEHQVVIPTSAHDLQGGQSGIGGHIAVVT
jgi:hypothetical protein